MLNLSDMIISGLLKKGVMCESRNVEINTEIPESGVKINIKIENVKIRFSKKDEEEA